MPISLDCPATVVYAALLVGAGIFAALLVGLAHRVDDVTAERDALQRVIDRFPGSWGDDDVRPAELAKTIRKFAEDR